MPFSPNVPPFSHIVSIRSHTANVAKNQIRDGDYSIATFTFNSEKRGNGPFSLGRRSYEAILEAEIGASLCPSRTCDNQISSVLHVRHVWRGATGILDRSNCGWQPIYYTVGYLQSRPARCMEAGQAGVSSGLCFSQYLEKFSQVGRIFIRFIALKKNTMFYVGEIARADLDTRYVTRPTTACAKAGYYDCGSVRPGMCCPTSYVCRRDGDCVPPVGATSTATCPTNYYACASSLGGGCCLSGMGCNLVGCFSTAASTYTITTGVTTTDSAGNSITSVSTYITIQTPSATATKTTADAVGGFFQSTVAKVPATETSSSSGGLNQAQLGGVIGGVVVIFLAVITAAFLVIRRLRQNAKLIEESKRGSSTANQTTVSYKPGEAVTATVTEIDINEVDPLTQEPKPNRPVHLRARSDSSVDGGFPSPAKSSGLSSGRSTPPAWPGHYNPVPNPDNGVRHASLDSAPEGHYDPAGRSQISRSSLNRSSYDSQTSNHPHGRHWSCASEVSGSADGAHGVSELEASIAAAAARRRSSSGASRPAAAHIRRTSDPYQRGRSDSSAPVTAPLGTLSEIHELHGYYGPVDGQVGQTAARLKSGDSPTTPEIDSPARD
ncbi:hypothetical protein SUNI508_11113 [Seiridium unicorne]|uniref:Uncharacterized protein n=1 Tax=Seiridium unicorne TaxID=138068 RepID=A0ABR2UJ73_9PEZI